jgi:RNA polymerase sigma-70 factor (ECF subfamily)
MTHLQPATEADGALIARSLLDPTAFAAVFDRHWPAIHRFCTSRAGAAGEDLAAEVFRIAFDQRRSFRTDLDDAAPWLYGIATNGLRRWFRSAERARRATSRARPRDEHDPADDALGRVEAELLGPRLADALRTLAADDRDTLLLYAWAGLTYEEVALATGVAVGTVRSRIHRARSRVRAHLESLAEEAT